MTAAAPLDRRSPSSPGYAARCADTARAREDPPLGTAPLTRRWLLIEHPGPWRAEAFGGAELPDRVRGRLTAAARAARARVLLIRRPGRGHSRHSRAWAVSQGGSGTVWGRWREPADLHAAAEVLEHSWTDLDSDPRPVLLVCTHGVHDACCAIRGRGVAAGLAEHWPEETWECSHLGGCRFAANVIVLPDGVYYGNLDPAQAVQVVEEHRAGRVVAGYLRGPARYPPVAQTAVGVAHLRWGPFGANDVRVRRIEQVAADRWEIDLLLPSGSGLGMTVQTSARPTAQLTCQAAQSTSAVSYAVTSVRELPELREPPLT